MQNCRRTSHLKAMLIVSITGMLSACGGAAPVAESPADLPEEPAPANDFNEAEAEDAAVEEEAPVQESVAVTTAEFQAALQIVMDDDALIEGMALTEPGRFPLKISGKDVPSDAMVTCVGQEVEVIDVPEDTKTTPVLVFVRVEFKGTMGIFKYRHDAAGIRGTTKVKREGDRWELMASRINTY